MTTNILPNNKLPNERTALLALCYATALLAVGATCATGQSIETIRFEQRSLYPQVRGGWASQRGATNQSADRGFRTHDDFSFASAEILTRFRWFGFYRDNENLANNPAAPNTSDWTINIHEDDGGTPGAELFSQTITAGAATPELAGTIDFFGLLTVNYYKFEITFGEPFQAEAGRRYWISPVSSAPRFSPIFAWYPGLADRGESHLNYLGHEMAFQSPVGTTPGLTLPVLGNRAMALIGRPANDLDGDGMDDRWEADHGLDASVADGDRDPDGDGVDNLREFELGSDPKNPDTDGDSLPDGAESNDGNYLDATHTGTSPTHADTDGDRLPDNLEIPGAPDSQGAGPFDTDPNLADSDGDGYDDAIEIDNGFNPRANASHPTLNRLSGLIGGDLTDPDDDGNANVPLRASRNAHLSNFGAFHAFDNQLANGGDAWGNISAIEFPGWDWVEIELDTPTILTHFTIASGSSSTTPSSDPHVWEIQGSNDGGQTWDTIFVRVNPIESVWTARSQVVRFDAGLHYATPPAYRRIRFFNDRPSELWRLQLGELEFFGDPHQCRITHIQRNQDGSIRLEWTSIPGVTYVIEESDDLQNWHEAAPFCPSGGTRTSQVIDGPSAPASPRTFFRVRER